MDSGAPASGDVREHAFPKAPLAKSRIDILFVQFEPPRHLEQVLV